MISFIIATLGRLSLARTLASIEAWPGDEVILVGQVDRVVPPPTFAQAGIAVRTVSCPPGGDWGSTERNLATPLAHGRYLAHIDDDDFYVPGHRALMAAAIATAPDAFTIFKMQYPSGGQVWQDEIIRWGNVGTPMMLIPNVPAKMGRWGERQDCGDLHFLQTMGWTPPELVWREDVIARIGQVHR
jgi:hypothetical protein